MNELQRDETGLGYTIVAEPLPGRELKAWAVKFTVYEIGGVEMMDASGKAVASIVWNRRDWTGLPDPVETLAEAQVWLTGRVKFDGCSDWTFHEHTCLHFCERDGCEGLGKLLALCWDWAVELGGWLKP